MIQDAAVFSVLSKCFAPTSEDEWEEIVGEAAWNGFLGSLRSMLAEDCDASNQEGCQSLGDRPTFNEFLSAQECAAISCPPSFEEKRAFAARHFIGGLPESAMPVESLYREFDMQHEPSLMFPHKKGTYLGESATYMRDAIHAVGGTIPDMFQGYPDHLALELDLLSVLVRSGMVYEARQFLEERFEWLSEYRQRLLALEGASFYIALVDLVIYLSAKEREGGEFSKEVDEGVLR